MIYFLIKGAVVKSIRKFNQSKKNFFKKINQIIIVTFSLKHIFKFEFLKYQFIIAYVIVQRGLRIKLL